MDLKPIRILYRDANLNLWGIPYDMRHDVGQTPRDLDKAGRKDGWIWLGMPGWWGGMSKEDQAAVKEFLAYNHARIPHNFYEWDYVEG